MSVIEAFVIEMQHELRTPVNAIVGYSELLLEEHGASISEDARNDLAGVIQAGQQILRIVSECLDVEQPGGDDIALCAVRMRHALHTPLTSVQGLAYLLIEEHQGTAICEDLRRIDAAAIRLAKVSDSLEQLYRVRLAAAQGGSSPAPATPLLEETLDRQSSRIGSVLVIDDEEINRDLLTRRLTHHGHVVVTADSGEAGLALAAREAIDLILLDVLMPGLSGYEVLS